MPLLSQSDYAKRRGCSEAAVNTARKQRIKAAEVIRDGKTLIDAEMADALWAQNTRRRRGSNPSSPKNKPEPSPPPPPAARPPTDRELKAFIMGLPEDQIPTDVNEIIRRKEHYNAERQRVAALRERGAVGSLADVDAAASRVARQLRDLLLIIPSRNAAKVAAMTDPEDIRTLLQAEIESALRGLPNEPA